MASFVSSVLPCLPSRCLAKLSCGGTGLPATARPNRHSVSQSRKKSTHIPMTGKSPSTWRGVVSEVASSRGNAGLVDETAVEPLSNVRQLLIRQEDTIIYNLLERAQYPLNSPTYDANHWNIPGFEGSLLDYLLRETERIQAKVGRYTNPDEHPFFPDGLPDSLLPAVQKPRALDQAADQININKLVWKMYFEDLLPKLAAAGDDDRNYGSTATCDVMCLQSLSKRIHFGKFVAEAKYQEEPEEYRKAIAAQNVEALTKLLTFGNVEKKVKRRVEEKAVAYGQVVVLEKKEETSNPRIKPDVIGGLYMEWVMPLTKKVQIEYLLHRLDAEERLRS